MQLVPLSPNQRHVLFLALALAFVVVVVGACSQSPSPTENRYPSASVDEPVGTSSPGYVVGLNENESMGRFLVFGSSGEPDTLDSMNTITGISLIVTFQIEETLVSFAPGSLDLVPALAESWEASEDATSWTFSLRRGVTFHDGTAFNADAVVFNFERMARSDFAYGFRDAGNTFPAFPYIFGGFAGDPHCIWDSIEAVDAYTVRFRLKQPTPLLPGYIAAPYFGISSPAAVKQHGSAYGTPEVGGVGTGPFKFFEWKPGQSLVLVVNEQYWGRKAKMPGVVFRFIDDASRRLAELQFGTIDFTVNLEPDARERIEQDEGLVLTPLEPFNVAYLSMNINNVPFDDVRVRRAVAYAIDKQAILEKFYGGIGTVADDFLPDVLTWASPDDIDPYAYNPAKAQALLAEAGYPDGFDTMTMLDGTEGDVELWYVPLSRPYYPSPRPIAESLVDYLAAVGIDVELKTEEWGTFLDNWESGKKNGLVMLGWVGDYGDPNNFLLSHFGPGNIAEAGYVNQDVFDMLVQASSVPTEKEAAEAFKQAGILINQDIPRVPLMHVPPVYAQRKELAGWVPGPVGVESFASIFIER